MSLFYIADIHFGHEKKGHLHLPVSVFLDMFETKICLQRLAVSLYCLRK